jgi:hypothetical protein
MLITHKRFATPGCMENDSAKGAEGTGNGLLMSLGLHLGCQLIQ